MLQFLYALRKNPMVTPAMVSITVCRQIVHKVILIGWLPEIFVQEWELPFHLLLSHKLYPLVDLQHSSLAMGFPLSIVMVCLFMKTLKADHCRHIIGRQLSWLNYMGDMAFITPRRMDLTNNY